MFLKNRSFFLAREPRAAIKVLYSERDEMINTETLSVGL
jgi:hypothetical protein